MALLKLVIFYVAFISFMTLLTKHPSQKKPTVSGGLSEKCCFNNSSKQRLSGQED